MDDCSIEERIQELTTRGHDSLVSGRPKEALESFQSALTLTETLDKGPKLKISSLLNAGACLVTIGEHQRGISLLQSSLSLLDSIPDDQYESEGKQELNILRGDVYYNLGLANQGIGDHQLATKQLKQSIDVYMKNDHQSTAGDVFSVLATCYKDRNELNQEETALLSAQQLYHDCNELGKEALCYSQLAIAYHCNGRGEECIQMLTKAKIIGIGLEDNEAQRQLYSQLGLIYSSLKMYNDAIQSFERALSLVKSNKQRRPDSIAQEASLLQNIGAVYNEMKQYIEAMIYHKTAAGLYNKAQLPTSEAKCLCNLASAQIQLQDYENALKSFNTALDIVSNTTPPDREIQFQALEGLGSVEYQTGQHTLAENHFKEALETLEKMTTNIGIAKERVMEKQSLVLEAIQENTRQESTVDVDCPSSKVSYLTITELHQPKLAPIPLTPVSTMKFSDEGVFTKPYPQEKLTPNIAVTNVGGTPIHYNVNYSQGVQQNGIGDDRTLQSSTLTSLTTTSDSSVFESVFGSEGPRPQGNAHSTEAVIPQGSLALGPNTKEMYRIERREIEVKKRGRTKSHNISRIVPMESTDTGGALNRSRSVDEGALNRSRSADGGALNRSNRNDTNRSKLCVLF